MNAKNEIAELREALRGMLEHCTCQGRGYRSWGNGRAVRECHYLTCQTARDLLGIPRTASCTYEDDTERLTAELARIKAILKETP